MHGRLKIREAAILSSMRSKAPLRSNRETAPDARLWVRGTLYPRLPLGVDSQPLRDVAVHNPITPYRGLQTALVCVQAHTMQRVASRPALHAAASEPRAESQQTTSWRNSSCDACSDEPSFLRSRSRCRREYGGSSRRGCGCRRKSASSLIGLFPPSGSFTGFAVAFPSPRFPFFPPAPLQRRSRRVACFPTGLISRAAAHEGEMRRDI